MRSLAIEAAVRVANGFGLRLQEPVLLRSTNNIVAWLRPAPIVAKVGMGRQPGFRREISVARELSALGAPVVPPSRELPAILHSRDGFEITFWFHCPQPSEVDFTGPQIAAALKRLHAAYATISRELRADLPSYMSELESVSELLCDVVRLSALPEADRHLLRHAFDHLLTRATQVLLTQRCCVHGRAATASRIGVRLLEPQTPAGNRRTSIVKEFGVRVV